MPVGQQITSRGLDVGALVAVESRLSLIEVRRSALHAEVLREVLVLHRTCSRGGMGLGVQAQLALTLGCSEHRAGELLTGALLLAELPGALEALDCGLLTVKQAGAVVDLLQPLPDVIVFEVWHRIKRQLITDAKRSVVRPPARLRRLITGWVITADPDGAVERRKDRQAEADVDYRRGEDGLVELFARGLSGPDAHACLSRIRACAEPVGSADDRPAGKRRLDALVDLLLGRHPVPATPDDQDPFHQPAAVGGGTGGEAQGCPCTRGGYAGRHPGGGGAGCGCLPGSPVPCGAALSVLVPLGAALGTTGELAELIGHGPLEPDLLDALLLAAPTLRAVWTDQDGIPVAVADTTMTLTRNDPASVQRALHQLATAPPGPVHPRHPDDHPIGGRNGPPGIDPSRPDDPYPDEGAGRGHDAGCGDNPGAPDDPSPPSERARPLPRLLLTAHPAGTPGPYRAPTRMRRLLTIRRPLCEWPGCGCTALRCDLDHDIAWPAGPTCTCQLGPLCRRHHRIKQLGWTKHRTATSIDWTGPTGRTWTSPTPHQPPEPWTRTPPELTAAPGPLDQLSPLHLEDELWHLDPTDPHWHDPDRPSMPDDTDPPDNPHDPYAHTTRHPNTSWTLDLDDPYPWLEPASDS